MKSDKYLAGPDREVFCMVPKWLFGKVSERACVLYAYISGRAGPDGWCWFKVDTYGEDVAPIKSTTFTALVNELWDARAVAAFKVHARGPAETGGGRNWGWAFYRPDRLDQLEVPMHLVIPTRVDRGTLTPAHDDLTCQRAGSDVIRTTADAVRKPRSTPPVVPERGAGGRFLPIVQDAPPRVLDDHQDASRDGYQDAPSGIHKGEPAQDPDWNETPSSRNTVLDQAVIEEFKRRRGLAAEEGAA